MSVESKRKAKRKKCKPKKKEQNFDKKEFTLIISNLKEQAG